MKYIIKKFLIVIVAGLAGIFLTSMFGFSDAGVIVFGGLLTAIAAAGAMTSWHPESNSKKDPNDK